MRSRYSIILPIAVVLSGVVLELNSLGIAGEFLPADLVMKIWPALLVFVGLDLLISQHRLVGGITILFFAAALLSTQFLGWNNNLWKFFQKVWPILLILFGLDWIFSGRSLINTAVIVAGVIILIYALFTFLDVPVIRELPFKLDLTKIIPTETAGLTPVQPVPQGSVPEMFPQPVAEVPSAGPSEQGGKVAVVIPMQNTANVNINAASGKISLKGDSTSEFLVSGSVSLDQAEQFTNTTDFGGDAAEVLLRSEGNAAKAMSSVWDLSLSPRRSVNLNAVVKTGYIKADLRNMNLSTVSFENKNGPIDVMVPANGSPYIRISAAGDDTIRIYVPQGVVVNCLISGTSQVDYNQYRYSLSGSRLSPLTAGRQNPVTVEITANGGLIQVIDNQ
ncbi:MAG: hypothetical protein IKP86_07235 [Anaerolineaceae bacterium]|nr:hypothetical protein [Anaerolineaceae bacterium]